MVEPVIERSWSLKSPARRVFVSDSGELVVAVEASGYTIFGNGEAISRETEDAVVDLISDREYVVVGEGKTLSFFNSSGTLLWKNMYDDDILSISFIDGEGVILMSNGNVILISGLKNEMGRINVRDDAKYVKMDPSGRFFVVVGKMGLDVYSVSSLSKMWAQEFMDAIDEVVIYRGANRMAVSLITGDFYLLNKNGRRILEFKFPEPPRMALDGYGNIVLAEPNKIKIMNERGTLLKTIEIDGKCNDMRSSSKSEYVVCGTNKGKIYFFNKIDVLWTYSHGEDIFSVDVTPSGEYVVAANKEVMIFNNLTYYLQILRDCENKLRTVGQRDPRYGKLADMLKRMKATYLKRDFKMLMNVKKVFDGLYSQIERSSIQYAFIVDSLFYPSQTSKNILYVKSENEPKIVLYGDVRYKTSKISAKGKIRKYVIILQPKRSGEIPIRVDIVVGDNKVSLVTKINADGMPRKKKVVSNTDYRKLIA